MHICEYVYMKINIFEYAYMDMNIFKYVYNIIYILIYTCNEYRRSDVHRRAPCMANVHVTALRCNSDD